MVLLKFITNFVMERIVPKSFFNRSFTAALSRRLWILFTKNNQRVINYPTVCLYMPSPRE